MSEGEGRMDGGREGGWEGELRERIISIVIKCNLISGVELSYCDNFIAARHISQSFLLWYC